MVQTDVLFLKLRAAGLPVVGLSIPDASIKDTWRVDYEMAPTDEQIAQAAAIIDEYDIAWQPVPTITRRQCRLWLLQQHGKTSADVEAAIAAIADAATREAARIEWEDATAFHHDHPLMTALAPALGIDPATLPDAFRAAALL